MLKENAPTFLDRSPMFPGSSCFPLSPDKAAVVNKSGFPHTSTDQLNIIFKVLGTPSEADIDFITDAKAIEYVRSWPPKESVDLRKTFPGATAEAIDLLQRMLAFNPRKRITVDQALEHPFLRKVRDATKEVLASAPVTLEFEKEGDLSADRLRQLFMEEVRHYKH
eukprot:TRINITY_DN0_c6885_g1_i1.p1 TRINITY_DN0_c6885_g1~~TRINITY_DN0_c6885_g1_i1.p1  ORF type:complete len:166 (-),score=55.10 TRINITY_DN0_c6885_g1_i1:96-593(-)